MDNKKTSHKTTSTLTRKKMLIGIPIAIVALFIAANLLGIISDAPLVQQKQDEDTTPLVFDRRSDNSSAYDEEQKILAMKVLPVDLIPNKAVEVWEVNRGYTILRSPNTPAKSDTELNVITTKESPLYQPEGYDFYLSDNKGSAVAVRSYSPEDSAVPTEKDKDFRETVATTYLGYGLQKTQTRNEITDVYTGKGLVCTVNTKARTMVTVARCGAVANYEKLAAQIAPIAALLPTRSNPLVFKDFTLTKLPGGAEQATVTVGYMNTTETTAAIFQKATKNGKWQQLQ